jgi:Ca2+-binding EF-hand superfamily protein
MHVLDLDNDGLISAAELTDALRFLRANLDEEDLVALLDRWGWQAWVLAAQGQCAGCVV